LRAQWRLQRFDNHIRFEFELIGHRMTWLMTSQSFLFAGYATMVSRLFPLGTSGTPVSAAPGAQSGSTAVVELLLWLIPFVGLVTALLAAVSVFAAKSVIRMFKEPRAKLEEKMKDYGYEQVGVPLSTWPHKLGGASSGFIPLFLLVVWASVLARYFWACGHCLPFGLP
jgi:hypothetical protein